MCVLKVVNKKFEVNNTKFFCYNILNNKFGDIKNEASPNQAKPEEIINLDLIATSEAIDILGKALAFSMLFFFGNFLYKTIHIK